jgi:hypothetical protein
MYLCAEIVMPKGTDERYESIATVQPGQHWELTVKLLQFVGKDAPKVR